jgi:hypothetical protein
MAAETRPPSATVPRGRPPRRTSPEDGFAVAGLLLSIFGFGLFGVVCCVVALVRIRRSGARGRGFAIAGLVISGAWAVLFVVMAASGWLSVPGDTATRQVSVHDLKPGVCLAEVPEGVRDVVDVVPCASSHEALVVAAFELAGGAYPGDEAVEATSDAGCLARLPAGLESRDDLEVHFLQPQRQGWASGDHVVTCIVAAASGALAEDLTTAAPAPGT